MTESLTGEIRIAWPVADGEFTIESSPTVGAGEVWSEVGASPIVEGDSYVVLVSVTEDSMFFRLRGTVDTAAYIVETSPANGAVSVAVTRETIFRLSAPLAPTTTIDNNQLRADFGGRRILGRVHISSNRDTVTLFHLEPLPGNARLRVTFDGDGVPDANGLDLDADGDGVPGGVRVVEFDTLGLTPVTGTSVTGRVFASELAVTEGGESVNVPLAGVTITVDGMEETLRTVTDDMGGFTLTSVPAGDFFVHIDGRTAVRTPENDFPFGTYYPNVNKKWTAVAGREVNVGDVFLPAIAAGTLQPVSTVSDTEITFPETVLQEHPELEGVSLTVPPNSLFANDGTPGGMVGIAPVPPDRIPGALPEGLDFPLVITIQTDGASNFDIPVPVRFPNLPDPITGEILPPGAKTAIWSFDHDTGEWRIAGPATVSEDGLFVVSDPGTGILAPGWHGTRRGVRGGGGTILPPTPPKKCDTEGAPCDDGDPCTVNDRCQNGVCKGDPPEGGPECPPNGRVALDASGWIETMTAGDGVYTRPTGFDLGGMVCYDPGSRTWKYNVTSFKSNGIINLDKSGYMTPNPTEGGNVTADNYCDILNSLENYLGRGRGHWHTIEASRVHEHSHRDDEWVNPAKRFWPEFENELETWCVPCDKPKALAEQIFNKIRSDAHKKFLKKVSDVWNAPSTHDSERKDKPYQDGQTELNETAAAVRKFAMEQGFAPCPEGVSGASLSAAALEGDPLVVSIEVTIDKSLFDSGETAQLTVIGTLSDGALMDVTDSPSTTYVMSDPEVATVSPDGMVTAVSIGGASVIVSHQPSEGFKSLLGVADFTVRSPLDMDDDGILDSYEEAEGLDPNDPTDATKDLDGDGLSNSDEFFRGTKAGTRDTDGDGVDDGTEVRLGTDPLGESAQPGAPQAGLHFYALLNLDSPTDMRRGVAGSNGVAHDNLILAPNTRYRHWVLQAGTLLIAQADFTTPDNGRSFTLPALILHEDTSLDTDDDGLKDRAEFILGTFVENPDSDDDGIFDGPEVLQGTNPLDGFPVQTGILGTVETPGEASDICAVNDLAIVADGSRGISIFNIFNGLAPTVIGQVETPGIASRVACASPFAVVADGAAGLAIIDISDPPSAAILHQKRLGGSVNAVAAAGGFAYAGSSNGSVTMVDMLTGEVVDDLATGSAIRDLFFSGDHLHALTDTALHVIGYLGGDMTLLGSVASPYVAGPNSRLFVGDDIAYAVHGKGYNTIDISNPSTPALIASTNTDEFGWKHIVANGSGLGIAAVSPNQAFDGPHDVSLYDVTDPNVTTAFITTYETPGVARAVSIYNGLAYIADHLNGMHVLNYRSFDTMGQPPTVTLQTNFSEGLAEEGQQIRVTVSVTDDVQVRNVDLIMDGEIIRTDGSFPFEARFITPRIADQPDFTLQARATDTGGNFALSDPLTITLVPDATPPSIVRFIPSPGSGLGNLDRLTVFFSEPVDPASINDTSFTLVGAGPDGELGTPDDVPFPPQGFTFDPELNAVYFLLPDDLPPAAYEARIAGTVSDLVGNPISMLYTSNFISGFGLQGEYFDNLDFTAPIFTRVDPTVDFDWGSFSPDPSIGPDRFSVRWLGRIVPRYSEEYTLWTQADDGVRLWIDGELIIDDWFEHPPAFRSGTVALEAGKEHDIRLEFFENGGGAVVQLYWQSPTQPQEIIPPAHLLPYEDSMPPFVIVADPQPTFEHVIVRYSETVEQTSAENPANYAIPGLDVIDARLLDDEASVLLTTSVMEEATLYLLTVSNVLDASDFLNPIDPGNSTEFYSLQISEGLLRRDVWTGLSTTGLVSDLTSVPSYPDDPNHTDFIETFEALPNWANYYGQQISGWVCPPTTGWYEFRIASDDQSELHLSTDDSPDNLAFIATEPFYNTSRNWTASRGNEQVNISAPVWLEAGASYFIRALHKEAGSGDHLAVLWRFLGADDTDDYFVIEAEDFDFGGGMHKPEASVMPYLGGAYAGESATDGVDYNDPGNPASTTYRPNTQGVATANVIDPARFGYDIATDHQIGWAAEGDWYNYTRTFPAGTYYVFARMSSPGNIQAQLSKVGPTTELLGTFTSGSTGNYSIFNSIPLDNPDGSRATVTLSGEETLRFTHVTPNCNFNYLVLIPANELPEDILFLERVVNGAAPIPGAYLKTYRSPTGRSRALMETFNGLAEGTLENLSSLDKFPDYPDTSAEVPTLEAPLNTGDLFGRRISGFIHIPITGEYRFLIASDGPGEFRLSSDDSPDNLATIAIEPQFNPSRYWTGPNRRDPGSPENVSSPLMLKAGDVLYFEALMAEGTGTDNLGVTWRAPWSLEPSNGSEPIPGDFLSILKDPIALELTHAPGDQRVDEESEVTFRVAARGLGPFRYQWLMDGEPIESATIATLVIPDIDADIYDGAEISVRVDGFGASVTSDPATLNVIRDTTSPAVLSATGETSTRIRLQFSEEMDATSSGNPANFSITGGINVIESFLGTDPTQIVLVTSPMATSVGFTITISGVTDDAPLLNPVLPGTQISGSAPALVPGFLNREIYENISGGAIANLTADPRFPNNPDLRDTLPTFESLDRGDNYGARVFGLIVPPVSGDYVFYISSDDASSLYLSTDEDPANAVEIAYAPGWSPVRQWTVTHQPDRVSSSISLVADERYYIEARLKEGGGGDHVEVTWQKPGDEVPANGSEPIQGEFLIGYESP